MMNRLRGVKRYWLIVAVVTSLFTIDWIYIRALRSLFTYQLQNAVAQYLTPILVITGFAWSQAIKTATGRGRPTHVLKIVAPLAYRKGGEERIGYKIISTHDLRNSRIELEDVYEELLVLQRNKEPEAILIRKVIPPPQSARYKPREADW